jgi:hypothetical protein
VRAAWFVRSRQLRTRFAFWISITGYDPRDRSINQKIYLVYAVIFFSIWTFAVLSLLAGGTASILSTIGSGNVDRAASFASTLIMYTWFLLALRSACRRSPFVFSEEDANLICQTPVDRSSVALNWLFSDWIGNGIPFWAGAVLFGFARAEAMLGGNALLSDISLYISLGLRAMSVTLVLQLALLSFAWTVGALRLRDDQDIPWMKLAALVLIFLVLLVGVLTAATARIAGFYSLPWQVALWGISFPMAAAFGTSQWIWGILFSFLLAIASLLVLWLASSRMNLSRAAQETAARETRRSLSQYGFTDVAREMAQRQRLGMGRPPTHLPGRTGVWSLTWKDVVQSVGTMQISSFFAWLGILLLGIASGFTHDLGLMAWILASWTILILQISCKRLRSDLRIWAVFRQLPFVNRQSVLADLVNPVMLSILLTWIGLAISGSVSRSFNLVLVMLAPGAAASAAAAAAFDILRQSRVDALLVGSVPDVGSWGALLSLVCVGIPAGFLWFATTKWILLPISLSLACLIGLALAVILWNLAARSLHTME